MVHILEYIFLPHPTLYRAHRELSTVSTKTYLVEDVSLSMLQEDDRGSSVTLASESESGISDLVISSRSQKGHPVRTPRSHSSDYTAGLISDEEFLAGLTHR